MGFAHQLLPQAEGLEHLHRATGDAIGLADLERAGAAFDQARADAGKIRQLRRQQHPGRPAADDQDIDHLGQLRLGDVGVAGGVAIQIELHVVSFECCTDSQYTDDKCRDTIYRVDGY